MAAFPACHCDIIANKINALFQLHQQWYQPQPQLQYHIEQQHHSTLHSECGLSFYHAS